VTVLLYAVGVLAIAFGVGLSIALHELGHLLPAKRFGVKVTQYMIGFGPTIWSRQVGETEYGLKLVPLGGYCRMIGMFPPRPGDAPGTIRATSTGRFSQLADEARKSSLQEITPGDEDRVFYKLPTHKKFLIMLGGISMNLLVAVVLMTGVLTLYGVGVVGKGADVAAVYQCVVPATTAASTTTCPTGAAPTPAYAAGLRPGDRIVSVGGQPVAGNSSISELVGPRIGQPTTLTVVRDGRTVDLSLTPVENTLPLYDEHGKPVLNADGTQKTHVTGFMGISSAPVVDIERQPLTAVPGYVGSALGSTAALVAHIPGKMVGVVKAAFGGGTRDPNGPISVVGVGRIAGEVTAGQVPGLPDDWAARTALLVNIIASLNLALFAFNVIPLLPFDGGHAAGALWEGVKRRIARLRRRPDPGYVDVARALPLTYGVSVLLITMTVLLVYADIVNPIKLGG
jgi:membrane-associated protease RseP (regulator of RpoE activity)